MKYLIASFMLCMLTFPISFANSSGASLDELDQFFDEADAFLKEYVDRYGGVDYVEIKESDDELRSIVNRIAEMNIEQGEQKEKIAFYINAYNLLVIDKLIKANIPSSPLDKNDFFSAEDITVHGQKMSLDQLEKEVLFKLKDDPRFHFVLVCGAKGCPPLRNMAYTPSNLENLLEVSASWAINYPRFTRVDRVGKDLYLSQIFKWYEDDFTTDETTLIDYANRYLTKPISNDFEISFYDYDWSINSQTDGDGAE